MPLTIQAEASCDQCGKTAPCRVDCSLWSGRMVDGGQEFRDVGVAVMGLPAWFYKREGMACSNTCKEILESTFTGRGTAEWTPCG
jgi:hypothetical protein